MRAAAEVQKRTHAGEIIPGGRGISCGRNCLGGDRLTLETLKLFDELVPQLDCLFHSCCQPLEFQGGFVKVSLRSQLSHRVSLSFQLFVKGTNPFFDLFSGAHRYNQPFQSTAGSAPRSSSDALIEMA
jgi:hypothetical protein